MAKRQQKREPRAASTKRRVVQKREEYPDQEELPVIKINSHRALAAKSAEIVARMESRPEIAALFLVNPALAMRDLNVELSSEMSHHVLHTVRHPRALTARREELEKKLEEELGEFPRPRDPKWLAEIVFGRLKVKPLSTRGLHPSYRDPLDDEVRERFEARRPKERGLRYPEVSHRKGTVLRVVRAPEALRRLDLEADLPPMKPAKARPKSLKLDRLFFYKDSHPLIRDLLELGIIEKRAFPIRSSAAYRKIKEGEAQSDFRSWIRSVKFKTE